MTWTDWRENREGEKAKKGNTERGPTDPKILERGYAYEPAYTGWPEEVSHHQELSLNLIKNREWSYIYDHF